MITATNLRQARRVQRVHDRQRIVAVVLVRTARPSTRTRAANVTGVHDSLRPRQVVDRADTRDRPRTRSPRSDPRTVSPNQRQQLIDLASRCTHRHRRQLDLVAIDRDCGVRTLVRIDTDRHRHDTSRSPWTSKAGAGTPDSERSNCRTSFEPRPRAPAGQHLVRNQSMLTDGRQLENPTRRDPDATSKPATPPRTQSGS